MLPSPAMVLGGKTLLWCENGIVFFTASAGSDVSQRPREPPPVSTSTSTSSCQHYPAEITFLPVVATSSFLPYLGDPPRKASRNKKKKDLEPVGRREEAEHRDEVVKSVGRLKIIQGSSLRADAFADEQPATLAISARLSTHCFMNRTRTDSPATKSSGVVRDELGQWNIYAGAEELGSDIDRHLTFFEIEINRAGMTRICS